MRRATWPAPLVAAAVALSCAPPAGDPDGTAIRRWSTDPVPLVSIGEVEGAAEYVLSGVAAVRLLADGGVAVADRSSGTVRIYDLEGAFVRSMGGIGDGPGEFRYLNALAYRPPDTLVAYDSGAQRLTRFLAGGALVGTVGLRAPDGRPEVYLGTARDGRHAAAWIVQTPRDRSTVTPDRMRIGVFDAEGDLVSELDAGAGMRRLGGPLPFSPHFLGLTLGDTVFHTDGLGGLVRATGMDGRALRTVRPAIEAWSPADAWARLEPRLDRTSGVLPDVDGHAAVDSIPAISDLIADDTGRLWVKRYDPATDSHWLNRPRTGGSWLVLTTGGDVVAELAVPDGFRLMDARGERIAGVARDELGVERVTVFTVRRDGG